MKEATSNLFTKRCFYSNFVEVSNVNLQSTILKGKVGKRIVCIVNLKKPKNHMALLCPSSITNHDLDGVCTCRKIFSDDYSEPVSQ
jgi:hypothetical protein